MTPRREYPHQPVVGVGGVIIERERVLLIRRRAPPLEGRWSIPGGALELGETLEQGVAREMAEETGLEVKVLGLVEVCERIEHEISDSDPDIATSVQPRYHFVIVDYLCAVLGGTICAGSDAAECAWAREDELEKFDLTPLALRVVRKAFLMARDLAQ